MSNKSVCVDVIYPRDVLLISPTEVFALRSVYVRTFDIGQTSNLMNVWKINDFNKEKGYK